MSPKSLKVGITGVLAASTFAGGASFVADQAINPYTQTKDGYVLPIADSLNPGAASRVIVATSSPSMTLSKWGGQATMHVTYDPPAPVQGVSKVSRGLFSRTLVAPVEDASVTMTPVEATTTMENGGMELNIELASKPASNVFDFAIEGSGDMDFYYQPPLNVEMGSTTCTETDCGGSHRPENVVGSYAVYSKEHRDHTEGETNYATGKLFHIFRPLVTDAAGSSTWATLSYEEGTLSVTVPQAFLDSAEYPVVVDPTFGYASAGASRDTAITKPALSQFAMPDAGAVVSKVTSYIQGTFSSIQYVGVIYEERTSGSPNPYPTNRQGVATAATIAASAPAAWVDTAYASPPTLASAANYWLGGDAQGSVFSGGLAYDSGGTSYGNAGFSSVYPPPDPYTSGGVSGTKKYSVYATYTTGGGGDGSSSPDSEIFF